MLLAPAAIFLAVLAAYWPAIRGRLVWDDDAHVTRAKLQSLHGLWRIWFEFGATQQYYPALHSAFWIEHRLWGDATVGYHLVNILLHATAACLFGLVLRRLVIPGAVLAALIFALHPVCVESVAWISEQKNTLSTVFYLLAALAYLRFDERRERRAYALAVALFVLALLTKSVTATLPGALLVILWWKRGRLSWKRDFAPLAPWLAIGAAAGLLTSWVERRFIGAEGSAFDLSLLERGLLAGRVFWFYLWKLIWPSNLIFIYPHWKVSSAVWWQYAFPASVLGLLMAFWIIRKRSRAPLAALLFFIGSLFPALGFFNVYPFTFSYVADHFQYLAMMGVIAAAAAAIMKAEVGRRKAEVDSQGEISAARLLPSAFRLPASAFMLLAVLGILTWRQCHTYRDIQTLYRTTLARNPDAWLVSNNLGVILADAGERPEAISFFEQALRTKPDYGAAQINLGNALRDSGRFDEAITHYRAELKLQPDDAHGHYGLGLSLFDAGRMEDAVAEYREALRLRPDYAEAHNNLGIALAKMGHPSDAIVQFGEALRLDPGDAKTRVNLGSALTDENRLPEAEAQYEEALRLDPGFAGAQLDLGNVMLKEGRLPEAAAHYREALRLNPGYAVVHYNLGYALQQMGRDEEAKVQFDEATRLGYKP